TPPSLSRISPLTWRVPLSLVEHVALAVELQRLQVVPLSQLKRYSKPAAVSTEEGSLGSVSERLMFEPSSTGPVLLKVAVGATLLTVTESALARSRKVPSSSVRSAVTL